MDFVKLFEPITINGLEIPNRIVMPSMGLGYTNDYVLNNRCKAFYRERAHGGVGLMTIGPVAINTVGCSPFMLGLYKDDQVGQFTEFLAEIHRDTDAKVAIQLMHMGRNAIHFDGTQPLGPSAIAGKMNPQPPREMSREDILDTIDDFAQTARRAKEAGFDFIEIIGCTGYLISQFLSPLSNQRTDAYGGSIENRMRFGIEVIRAVREIVGDAVPVGIRVAGNDFMKGGHTNTESAIFAAEAEEAGVDAINVTGGWHETYIPQLTTIVPQGAFVYLAKGIKDAVTIPVFASNRLGNPEVAEKALRSGSCDMVCWGRPLIADPDLPKKVKQGRLNEITPCIACNQGCFDQVIVGGVLFCVLNPRAGREEELTIERAENARKVVVAGGGPAGMEFALTAAQRGHDVTLHESDNSLGGQVNLAKASPGKAELDNITRSLEGRMRHCGVDVRLNSTVDIELLKAEKPDVLAVASGAVPIEIDVPGVDKPHVVSAWDVLSEKVWDIGKNVVIIGGSATGCETAHFISTIGLPDAETCAFLMYHEAENRETLDKLLHKSGRKVTVIDMVEKMASNVGRTSRWSLVKSLRLSGVNLVTHTKLMEITDDAVVVSSGNRTEEIPADTVVLAIGARSNNQLAEAAKGLDIHLISIGDAKEPRKISDAIREGFEEALAI